MNYMPKIAKMLGVELGEKFEINENASWICSFTNDGFVVDAKSRTHINQSTCEHILASLIGCVYTIKRKPWKPNINDIFYFVDEEGYTYCDRWCGDSMQLILYKIGNCYRTKEEAEVNSAKWIEFYKSDEVLEI